MNKNALKILLVLLTAVVLFSFSSCAGKGKNKAKDSSKTTDTPAVLTDDAEKKGNESEIATENDNLVPPIVAGAATNGKDGSAKPGGKDTGKDPGKSDDNKKSTGSNTSETSKPTGGKAPDVNAYSGQQSGGKSEETTSTTEPEEKDNEGEFAISSEKVQLPIVRLR